MGRLLPQSRASEFIVRSSLLAARAVLYPGAPDRRLQWSLGGDQVNKAPLSAPAWLIAVEYSPFYGIEKGAVLQEARVFNEPHVDPRKCQQVITKLLYLLTQGESFTKVGSLFGIGTHHQLVASDSHANEAPLLTVLRIVLHRCYQLLAIACQLPASMES